MIKLNEFVSVLRHAKQIFSPLGSLENETVISFFSVRAWSSPMGQTTSDLACITCCFACGVSEGIQKLGRTFF
jgi:hypothetical protein